MNTIMNTTAKLASFLFIMLLVGCASLRSPVVHNYGSLEGYRYVFINATGEHTSSSGVVYGNQYGTFGSSSTKSINPGSVISGYFLKNGYVVLPELKTELLEQTLIVSYGESGRRNLNFGYTIEITLQLLSAKTNEVVCVSTAEGQGSTEADDVRIAINRALSAIFGGK